MDIKFLKQITDFNKLGESYNITPKKNNEEDKTSIFDMFKNADTNKNGKIDTSELNTLYGDLDLNYSEYDELEKLAEEFNKLYAEMNGGENALLEATNTDDLSTEGTNSTNSSSNSSFNPTNNTNNTNNNNNNANTNNGDTQKSLENMTLDELKAEKASRQEDVDKARENINAVHSGQNSAVKSAQTDAETAEKAYDEVMEQAVEQKVITEELNARREQNLADISTKEGIISGLNADINTKEGEINTTEGEISSAKSNLSALKDALASYDNADKDDKDAASKRASLEKQIAAEEENIRKLEEKKEKLEGEKQTLEGNLSTEESALTELEAQKSQIEQEIMTACQQAEPQLQMAIQQAMTDFNNAKSNVETVKAQELSAAQAELKTAETGLKEVNKAYEEKSASTIKGKNSYKTTEMEAIVNYYGEDYLSVLSQEEIDKVIALAKKNKMANIYPGRGSDCLNISYNYEKWALGKYETGLNQFHSEDLDATVQKMAEVLNSGKPVVAKVNTQKGSRHFVLVIGLKQGASAPYKQSDFLCIDSYNAQVDGMGGSGNVEGNYRTLYAQNNKYWLGSHAVNFA